MARKGYIQLVNGFYMNRKVRKLRHTCPSAIGAFTMMLTFCGDNLSDGHISEDDALYVLDITDSELEALCNVGMIEPDGNNGYYIHDYLIHNRSREQVQKKRESNAENYRKNKNEVKTSDSDDFQTAESRLNRDKHQNTRTPEHQNELSKDNSTPPTPSKPDFAGLLDGLERIYPTNRFDGKTSQARMQLRAYSSPPMNRLNVFTNRSSVAPTYARVLASRNSRGSASPAAFTILGHSISNCIRA